MRLLPLLRALVGAGAVSGAALTAYAARETRQFRLRRVDVPILPPGQRPLRVLHLSDIHMTPGQRAKQEWLASLSLLAPDLVVDTGDNLAHRDSVPVVRDSLGPLLERPGVFVHGSNDYFEPTLRNPLRYLLPDTGRRHVGTPQLPWAGLTRALSGAGWLDLTNRRASLVVGETTFAFAGVDDPHLGYDRLEEVRGQADPTADVRIGVAHAPYLRVLDQYAADGYDAGARRPHPRRPGVPPRWPGAHHELRPRARAGQGSAPPPRRLAARRPGSSWLHVSAGIGTSPYARIRLNCRPEATLLTLVPRDARRP